MKTLSNTIGSRINEFDNLEFKTVETFNTLFHECPIKQFTEDAEVEILSPTSNNCRFLLVGGTELVHKMYSDLLYNVDKSEYRFRHDDEDPTDCLGFEMED
jgi:hypothetical protein